MAATALRGSVPGPIDRRGFVRQALVAAVAVATPASRAAAEAGDGEPELGEDGLYRQPWFLNSFLDLAQDLAETAAAGKRLAIFWEQRGDPYCRDMHLVNLAEPGINRYVRDNFNILQLNLWGARAVTDFDGQVLAERDLATKWAIVFTPTILFLPESVAAVAGRAGGDAVVARLPGYFQPFHFIGMFRYVRENAYRRQHFQRYIQDKAARDRARWGEVKLW